MALIRVLYEHGFSTGLTRKLPKSLYGGLAQGFILESEVYSRLNERFV